MDLELPVLRPDEEPNFKVVFRCVLQVMFESFIKSLRIGALIDFKYRL